MEITLGQDHIILAVDDEPSNLRMLERLLRRHFKVLTAANGEEALQVLRREKVAVIITDQRMPGMLGTELLRRCQAIAPDVVSLMVTATSDMETFIEAIRKSGASRVITKPWDPDEMLYMVKQALAQYERGLENERTMSMLKQVRESLNEITKAG